MNSTSVWWPWQGSLCRRAYLLARPTALGWHSFSAAGFCTQCFQPWWGFDALCREFLVAIPAATSDVHSPPAPEGRLF